MQTRRSVTAGICLFSFVMALAGCAHKDDASGTLHGSPAQVQQAVQEQAAQRAAYYNSHPTQGGQSGQAGQSPVFRGHP